VRGSKKGVEPKLNPLCLTYPTHPTYLTYPTCQAYATEGRAPVRT
jgi:hypothetical protein